MPKFNASNVISILQSMSEEDKNKKYFQSF